MMVAELNDIQNSGNETLIPSTSPATGEVLGKTPSASYDDVLIAVERSRAVFEGWQNTNFDYRKERLLLLNDIIHEKIDEIASIIHLENGKPRTEAITTEIMPSMYLIQWVAKNAERILKDEQINMFLWRMIGKKSYIQYKPLGVVGVIAPWNYPWGIPVGQVASALMTGNGVVLKPSSKVPLISEKIREVFAEAGFPEGLFSVVQGSGKIGEALIDAQVDRLVFTGSVEIGRHVNQLAAKQLIPTTLELGGKDPMIVLEDADIDVAASGAVWGAFANSGQTCASVERVYVVEPVFDEFVKKVVEKTEKLRQGPDVDFQVDVGAMTSSSQLNIVWDHLEDAIAKGAKLEAGGDRRNDLPGDYFEPTVLTNVCHSMKIMTEETFGPVLPIQKVAGEKEAVRLANDSRYGLTASVWTRDIERGKKIASSLVTGTVTVNDALFTFGVAETPWGGVKESGLGRTHGNQGLHDLVRPLHINVDTFPKIKKPWWYPYNRKLYNLFKKATIFFTGKGVGRKSAYLFEAVKELSLKNKY